MRASRSRHGRSAGGVIGRGASIPRHVPGRERPDRVRREQPCGARHLQHPARRHAQATVDQHGPRPGAALRLDRTTARLHSCRAIEERVDHASGRHPREVRHHGCGRPVPTVLVADGEWLAYTSNRSGRRQVHLYQFDTGTRRQLTVASSSLRSAWAPAWSPDGQRIAFVARVPGQGPLDQTYVDVLMTVDAAGAQAPVQLTSEYYASRPDWIPNGSRLLFSLDVQDGREVCPDHAYSIASDGSETSPTRLGTTGCWEFDPVRSPDGRRTALYSTEPDPFFVGADRGLYVARPNGTRQRLLVRNVRQGLGIDWQRR